MAADLLTILIILSLGLFTGTGIGLLIGFLLKTQPRDWHAMTRRQLLVNAALVLACSAICIGSLAWYAFAYTPN
jgi:hypothetical protein